MKEELWMIFNGAADSVETLSDSEFRSELEANGKSFKDMAQQGRSVIESALKTHKQKGLRAARVEYDRTVERLKTTTVSDSYSPTQRRQVLGAIVKRQPELGRGLLTTQHRNFEDLPDEDVESALEQLADLGAWDGKLPDDSGSED